jgi:hypothetical protein
MKAAVFHGPLQPLTIEDVDCPGPSPLSLALVDPAPAPGQALHIPQPGDGGVNVLGGGFASVSGRINRIRLPHSPSRLARPPVSGRASQPRPLRCAGLEAETVRTPLAMHSGEPAAQPVPSRHVPDGAS